MKHQLYNSVQEMLGSYTGISAGDICDTLGYYTPLDGGKARYRIKSDSSSENDGGCIIRLSSSLVAELVVENCEINALQLGAHNNWNECPNKLDQKQWSKYDNRLIFEQMMIQARKLKCNVYIPNGVYMCLPVKGKTTCLTMNSGMTLRGAGASTIITFPTFDVSTIAGTNGKFEASCFSAHNTSGFVIKDIVFDGNRHWMNSNVPEDENDENGYFGGNTMYGITGVTLFKCTDGILKNVTCQNIANGGFRLATGKNITFHNCKSLKVDCGLITIGDYQSEEFSGKISNIIITDFIIDGHVYSEGISIFQDTLGEAIIIANNIISNKVRGNGIYLGCQQTEEPKEYNRNVIIANNIVSNTAHAFSTRGSSCLSIIGNVLNESIKGSNMNLRYCKDVLVSNNHLFENRSDNVNILSSKHVILNNNLLKDNTPNEVRKNENWSFINLSTSDYLKAQDTEDKPGDSAQLKEMKKKRREYKDNEYISIHGNHISQQRLSYNANNKVEEKYISFLSSGNGIVFSGNDTYHFDSNHKLVPINIRMLTTNPKESEYIKNSYIEVPPGSKLSNAYPVGMLESRDRSNVVFRRVDELKNGFKNNTIDELDRCCIVAEDTTIISTIDLKPINTCMILVLKNNRKSDTNLLNGNIRFKQTGYIPKNAYYVIKLVSFEEYVGDSTERVWLETSRTRLA